MAKEWAKKFYQSNSWINTRDYIMSKYFYVCQKYPNNPIIMVDDDLIFFDNLVDSLMNKYMK